MLLAFVMNIAIVLSLLYMRNHFMGDFKTDMNRSDWVLFHIVPWSPMMIPFILLIINLFNFGKSIFVG